MTKERLVAIITAKEFTEEEYTGKTSSIHFVINNVFGKCEIITAKQSKEELVNNECFYICDPVKESKYIFFVDEEINKYYAVPKNK